MTTIAHLSDSHFGALDERARDALLADLHANPTDLVLFSGDITQRARSAQFRAAREFIDALPPGPHLTIPGNHDIPLFDIFTRLFKPYRLYQRFISADLEPSFENETTLVLCLNTTRRTRHINGELSDEQIQRIGEVLERSTQPFKVVTVHQPLAAVVPSDLSNLVIGAARALERWISAGADLFLGGHIHLPYCVEVSAKAKPRSSIVLQAGTSVSVRIRSGVPNSYNRISLTRRNGVRCMRLERRDFDAAADCFCTHSVHEPVDGSGGWKLPLREADALEPVT
jgi:3',5'-cyclic AMP phosphodiesterase CpdA